MIEPLSEWIRRLVAASVIAALAGQLTPDGPVRKVTSFVCGVMLLSVLVSPAVKADLGILADAAADYRATAARLTEDMEAKEKQLLRVYIQEQTEAYILDEAERMGVSGLQVKVLARWKGESWVPQEASISGQISSQQQERLSDFLCAELGIPKDRQRWNE